MDCRLEMWKYISYDLNPSNGITIIMESTIIGVKLAIVLYQKLNGE